MFDFRLDTFLSVCDTMNYRQSAKLLHISQPAVTQHIQYLERSYGQKLFQYEGRKLRKTRAGVILEQYARTMKNNERSMMHQLENTEIHSLSIGITKTIAEFVISKYAEKFISCEGNELSMVEENTEQLLQLLDAGKLDFALIEGGFDRNKYGYMPFSTERFVGICSATHPFADREITIQELLGQTLLCREAGSCTRAMLENKLQEHNESISHFKRNIFISNFHMILDYVKKGIGVSFVYEILAKQAGLSTFTVQDCQIDRSFFFVYRNHTGAEEKINRFMEGWHMPVH